MEVIHKGTPKVSIGMPVYNGEKYIQEALDSLLAQTFTDFELIISDNASTDNTRAICQEYAKHDSRIRYIRQSQNKGAAANFKFVLDEAVGEYFMWAAHDDLWSVDYLICAVELLNDKKVDFVFPTFELKSIHFGLAKKFNMKIFNFIESEDRRERVLKFISLHYLSHSANIVYSLFRKKFLQSALDVQDIGNDGVLCAVILGLGRGKIAHSLFSKRYAKIWPGILLLKLGKIKNWVYRKNTSYKAYEAINVAKFRMLDLFPEFTQDILFIYSHYKPYKYNKDYSICSIESQVQDRCSPKVSIGMPVYNGEKYIKEALDSLLSQSYSDFELIISDNASTDKTEQICEEYAQGDSRIRYIRQAQNKGAIANFQFVLDEAVGEYFMWAAADDKWSDNWIEVLIKEIIKTKNIVFFGQVITIDAHSKHLNHPVNSRIFNFSGNKFLRRVKYYFELESLGKANVIYGLYNLNDIKHIDLSKFEFDYNINYELLRCLEMKSTQDVTLYKRLHSNNAGEENTSKKLNEESLIKKYINGLCLPFNQRRMFLVSYIVQSTALEKITLIMLYLPKIILMYLSKIKQIVYGKY